MGINNTIKWLSEVTKWSVYSLYLESTINQYSNLNTASLLQVNRGTSARIGERANSGVTTLGRLLQYLGNMALCAFFPSNFDQVLTYLHYSKLCFVITASQEKLSISQPHLACSLSQHDVSECSVYKDTDLFFFSKVLNIAGRNGKNVVLSQLYYNDGCPFHHPQMLLSTAPFSEERKGTQLGARG